MPARAAVLRRLSCRVAAAAAGAPARLSSGGQARAVGCALIYVLPRALADGIASTKRQFCTGGPPRRGGRLLFCDRDGEEPDHFRASRTMQNAAGASRGATDCRIPSSLIDCSSEWNRSLHRHRRQPRMAMGRLDGGEGDAAARSGRDVRGSVSSETLDGGARETVRGHAREAGERRPHEDAGCWRSGSTLSRMQSMRRRPEERQ